MSLRHFSEFDFRSSQMTTERIDGDSCTEPNMSYTIKELLLRFGVGNTPPVDRQVYFDELQDEDATLDNISPTERGDFDLADSVTLQQQLAENRARHERARQAFRKSNDSILTNNVTTINDDANKQTEMPENKSIEE